ncbi:MAG: hypothetical protein ACP5T9_02950 [Thermoplasmata archaeon]
MSQHIKMERNGYIFQSFENTYTSVSLKKLSAIMATNDIIITKKYEKHA